MNMQIFPLIFVAVLNIMFAFLIIFRTKREHYEWTFGMPPLAIACWETGIVLLYLLGSRWPAVVYIPYAATSFIFPTLLIFLILFADFPKHRRNKSLLIVTTAFFEIIFLWLTFSPGAVIKQTIFGPDGQFQGIRFGPYYIVFLLYIIVYAIVSLGLTARAYRVGKGIERIQFLYIFVGAFVSSCVGIVTSGILPLLGYFGLFWVGPTAVVFFTVLMYYAVAKHHLLNVRVLATEWFAGAIVLIFSVNLLFAKTPEAFMLNALLLLLVIIFSFFLVRGTLREVRELERISDAKSEFISIASHQLRTPLTAIKGYISLLLEGTYGPVEGKPEGILKKVYASNERLSNIVEDLLNVSRMDQGRLVYTFVRTDLVHVIEEIIDELKISAEIKHVDLVFEKPNNGTSFVIQADQEKLHQAIANLVDNALKYTMQGSVRVMLERGERIPGTVTITVRDTGIGLTADDKKKIFGRFSRGQGGMRVNANGSGLGLFIAKTVVEAHKGTLRAESRGRNQGSSFIMELPLGVKQPVTNI